MANDILITAESLKHILPVYENHILEQVKNEQANNANVVEPLHDDTPTVFITGIMPETKNYVTGELEYVSKTDKFHAYTYLKLQGNSTLAHPKKNFTAVLYEDESRSKKLNKNFKNWGAHNNFVLKADYNDILHARNVVCAKLWSKVVASRPDYDTLPEELRNSPNNGAIDGFPVKVYINGEYQGLYCWTIPKCDWMFGMNANNENHALLSAEFNDNGFEENATNPCNFNSKWDGSNEYFDVEVGKLNDDLINVVNLISIFVKSNDMASLEIYLDIQSAIDYLIFQEVILGIDGLAKNMLLATYDMNKWYISAYDMDSTFDMHWEGYLMDWYDAETAMEPYLNQYSSLWQFIWDNYWDAYIERYTELRKSVLSYASIMSMFEEYVGIYGEDEYIKDTVPFPDIPEATTNTPSYLSTFIKNRLAFLDEYNEVVI